jgi:hypothetical protein
MNIPRIENRAGHIVGAVQFYAGFTYEMIIVESDALSAGSEIGYRFTPGSAPSRGEKRRIQFGTAGPPSEDI